MLCRCGRGGTVVVPRLVGASGGRNHLLSAGRGPIVRGRSAATVATGGAGAGEVAAVPVVDVSPFCSAEKTPSAEMEEKEDAARAVQQAFESSGVFLASGHGVPPGLWAEAFRAAERLFALKEEQKTAVQMQPGPRQRGYVPFGAESGRPEIYEPKEGYCYGYDWPCDQPGNALQASNVWPDGFARRDRDTLQQMYTEMIRVGHGLVRAFALALGLNEDAYAPLVAEGDSVSLMRIMHYHPASENPSNLRALGSSPHTDWGFTTLVGQSSVGGLQFRPTSGVHTDDQDATDEGDEEGRWVDVPAPAPGAEDAGLVVNCGDFLSLLTRGRFKSPVHRVLCPSAEDARRTSFVLFFYPGYDCPLDPSMWETGGATAGTGRDFNTMTDLLKERGEGGGPVLFGDYMVEKWQDVYRSERL